MKLLSYSYFFPSEQNLAAQSLPPSLKRRAPRIWKTAYAAAAEAIARSPLFPEAVVCGTALGALDETVQFMEKIHRTNMGSPRQFIASVHNSMAGTAALEFGITGSNMTVCESSNSAASALFTAQFLPESVILIIICDEHISLLDGIFENCVFPPEKSQEGALALVLSRDSSELPQITASPASPGKISDSAVTSLFGAAQKLAELLDSNEEGSLLSYSPTADCSAEIEIRR